MNHYRATSNNSTVTGGEDAFVAKISAPDRVISYGYDGLLRLIGAMESPGSAYAYAYDSAGNRTSVQVNGGTPTSFTYNAANQVTNTGWQYDQAGNLTNDGTTTYTYDALNRMTQRGTTAYTSNGDGVFAKQVASGVTTLYTQDLASPLSHVLQVKVGTAAATNYLYGAARLASLAGSTRTWYAADALGSVRRALSDTGTPLGIVNYDPWGMPESGTVPTFGFTGELHDSATGLVNLRARWYSTAHSTFTSRDPFAGVPEQPYSFNPYQYAYGDPVLLTDPTGRCSRDGDDYCFPNRPDPSGPPPVTPGSGPVPPTPPATPTPPPAPPIRGGKNVAQGILDESGGVAGAGFVAVRAPGAAAIAGLFCLGVLVAVASSGVVVRPATDYRFAIELVPAPQPASTPTPMEVVLPQPAPTSVPTSVPTPAPTPDPCDSLDVLPGASVAQVVGRVHLKPAQTTVTKSIAVRYARLMCKGVKFPPVHVTYGATYDTLTDGHHRFVASRLAHKPIGEVPDPYTPRNLRELGADWPAVEWRNVGWR